MTKRLSARALEARPVTYAPLGATGVSDDVWTDTYRQVHPTREKEEATFHGFKGTKVGPRIDFILHSRQFRTAAAEIDRAERNGRYPSDHYPVWAEMEYVGK